MFRNTFARSRFSSVFAVALLALVGCNDKDTLPPIDDHDHDHVETAGRLVVGQASPATAHVIDLDDGRTLRSLTLDFAASAIYASPDHRYAVLLQRTSDQVQFVDGGLWQEDHGDHLHDYAEDPLLLALKLQGARPTHYEVHDTLAALFHDGNAATAQNAGVAVLSDASLGSAATEATLDLPIAMHGTAEPRGDFLLTTHREAGTESTLPSAVDLYRRNVAGYDFVERIAEPCPGLHGSYSNDDYTLFGCTDGVLVVEQNGETFTASKIANVAGMAAGARIGTVVGHHDLEGFGGFAGNDLYAIDPSAGSMRRIDWAAGAAVTKIAHAMDAEGERFLILDSAGTLRVLDPANGWANLGSLPVISSFNEGQAPVITLSHAEDLAFVTDPADRSIAVIDLETLSERERLRFDFAPSAVTWLGIAEEHAAH